ncbi:MAG: hypothetical protein KBC12_00640 [Candidatus Pacebacteria bacterium]|nr:hypothetical protein [Candidatus Paceibacterota bacterium]MBP9851158.1 hypothetical protein [Candidatus Paceibacterota bacterium]
MKFDSKNILNLLKKKKVWKKNDFEINPNLYWRYLLVLVVVVIAGSFVFGVIIYGQIKSEPLSAVDSGRETERSDQKNSILEMLEYFETRKEKSELITNSPSPVVDPSI